MLSAHSMELQVGIAVVTLVRDDRVTGTRHLMVWACRYQIGEVAGVLWLEVTCHLTCIFPVFDGN